MINEAKLDSVITELRMELDRIDRAILVFEKMAIEKGACRNRNSRQSPFRLKGPAVSRSARPSPVS